MRGLVYVAIIIVGAVIGYYIGEAMLPEGAELETAVYPAVGTIAGSLTALAIVYLIARGRRG